MSYLGVLNPAALLSQRRIIAALWIASAALFAAWPLSHRYTSFGIDLESPDAPDRIRCTFYRIKWPGDGSVCVGRLVTHRAADAKALERFDLGGRFFKPPKETHPASRLNRCGFWCVTQPASPQAVASGMAPGTSEVFLVGVPHGLLVLLAATLAIGVMLARRRSERAGSLPAITATDIVARVTPDGASETDGAAEEDDRHWRRGAFVVATMLSIALSVAYLGVRNIYDDEITTLAIVVKPVRQIRAEANSTDVHPPGMYVLARAAWLATGSERWLALVPLAVLMGGVGVFAWRVGRHVRDGRAAYALFLLVAWLNPHLLMWGNSMRWYPTWTGLALGLTALWVVPPAGRGAGGRWSAGQTVLIGATTGLTMAAMFYLNYVTLLFGAALLIPMLSAARSRGWASVTIAAGVAGALFALLAAPQLGPMLHVHLKQSAGQRGGLAVSLLRLGHGVFVSEAMMPWAPAAVAFFLLVVAPLMCLAAVALARRDADRANDSRAVARRAGAVFVVLFLLGAASGLGGKPRSFIVLAPLLAVPLATGLARVRRPWLRVAVLVVTVAWIGWGAFDLLARRGTAKAGLNDHPDEVIALLAREATGKRAVVVTTDPTLTYMVNRAARRRDQAWAAISYFDDPVAGVPRGTTPSADPEVALLVRSSTVVLVPVKRQLDELFADARAGLTDVRHEHLSRDLDYTMKRRLPGMSAAAELPEYRFDVTWGVARPGTDWDAIARRLVGLGDAATTQQAAQGGTLARPVDRTSPSG
jgi:hypothetical protein